jgi:NAD(P)H-nitrite reductase large subunit
MPKGWKVLVGGNGGSRPRLSQEIAKDLSTDQVFALVNRIIDAYKKRGKRGQRLGAFIENIGLEEFTAMVLTE